MGSRAGGEPCGGTIDCHRLDLSACTPQDLDLLDRAERERAARFRFDRDRTRYIAAHAQARRLLGERLGLAPAAVPLATTGNGKPVLDTGAPALASLGERERGLCFNLTHSGAVGYLAIAPFSVGIDLELYRSLADLQPLIDSYCSPREILALAALPVEQRGPGFLAVWTRKEAALKAWGTGIGAIALDELHVGTAAETTAPLQMTLQMPLQMTLQMTPRMPLPALPQMQPAKAPPISAADASPSPASYPGLQLTSVIGAGEVLSIAGATAQPLSVRLVARLR